MMRASPPRAVPTVAGAAPPACCWAAAACCARARGVGETLVPAEPAVPAPPPPPALGKISCRRCASSVAFA
ncbi:MAG: hypothetical protein M5U28_26785 [Sandaracinaceae bacterium]|nr:hypothetical protein [Sandaracinaceae bacterium]